MSNIIYSTTGNDTTGDGSVGTPYKTPTKAGSVAVPGDSVVGRGGTHSVNSSLSWSSISSGSSGSEITYTQYEAEPVVWQSQSSVTHGLYLTEKDYLIFQNMEWDTNGNVSSHMARLDQCDHVSFISLDIHDNVSPSTNMMAFYFGQTTPGGANRCNNLLVKSCILHDTGNHAMYVNAAADLAVEDTLFYNIDNICVQVYTAYAGTDANMSHRFIFRGNRCFNWNVAQVGNSAAALTVGNGADSRIYNNEIFYSPYSGAHGIDIAWGGGNVTNLGIYHNLIHELGGAGIFCNRGSGHEAKNNIILNTSTAFSDAGSLITESNNLTSGTITSLLVDPSNATKSARDYHTIDATKTTIVDAGVSVGIAFDKDGVVRPQGAAPDIGPYELLADDQELWSAASQNVGGSWNDSTLSALSGRILIDGSVISASASTIKIQLKGRTSGSYTLTKVSLCNRDGSTLDSSDVSITNVTFGDTWANGVTVSAGETVTSDDITFSVSNGQDVFFTFYASGSVGAYFNGGSSNSAWFVSGDVAGDKDWAGKTIALTRTLVYDILVIEEVVSPVTPSAPGISVNTTQTVTPGVEHDLNASVVDQNENIVSGYAYSSSGTIGFNYTPSGCTVTHKTS